MSGTEGSTPQIGACHATDQCTISQEVRNRISEVVVTPDGDSFSVFWPRAGHTPDEAGLTSSDFVLCEVYIPVTTEDVLWALGSRAEGEHIIYYGPSSTSDAIRDMDAEWRSVYMFRQKFEEVMQSEWGPLVIREIPADSESSTESDFADSTPSQDLQQLLEGR